MTTNRQMRAAVAAAVKVGDELIVTDGGQGGVPHHRVRVTKAGPAWLTMGTAGGKHEWKLRRDTRTSTNDGNKTYAHSPRWWTVQEWAEREASAAAWTTVREQRVSVHHGSEWNERIVELAQRLTAPLPRGVGHVATIEPVGVKSTIRTGPGCESKPCAGTLTISLNDHYMSAHLTEEARIALIEALGGVA